MTEVVNVLVDEGGAPAGLLAALSARFAVRRLSPRVPSDLAMLSTAPTLIDVDLGNAEIATSLRDHLPKRGAHERIVAVDPKQRAERIQAGIFGATHLIARPYGVEEAISEIERALVLARRGEGAMGTLDRDLGRGRVPLGVPERGSILAAETALTDLFTACLGDGEVDGRVLREAGDQITGAIAEAGFETWMDTVRRHHGGTYQHCMLVTGIAVGFGSELGMSPADVDRLAQAGLTHDVGKARVPIELLDKAGRLTDDEFSIVKMHPEWGWDFLKASGEPIHPMIMDGVLHHHEALDGSGYPFGLKGRHISDMTRVLTVCDIYGALSERRSYKPPMAPRAILEIMYDLAGKGKIERSLVRALDWVVTRERPAGFSGATPGIHLRSA